MFNLDKNLVILNNSQQEAVKQTDGSQLILAGAGSGKTRVITSKIYYILYKNLALPNQILAVTFTNKAANEMKSRVSNMINQSTEGWWVGTFHSISAKIVRRHAEIVGLKNNFIIIDQEDQTKLIKSICDAEKIDLKEKNAKFYTNSINRYKNQSLLVKDIFSQSLNNEEKKIAKIYSIYENELLRLNCCDFGNLLLHCINIFTKNKEVLKQYQWQFKYIFVDEYQDTNFAQQKMLKLLYNGHKNLCCVGDDDQSIYSWRGADIKNILTFEKTFNTSTIFRLEQNYRSTKRILNCASKLISNNRGRYKKELWSNNILGDKIQIKGFWETKEEAASISDHIELLISSKISLNNIAILMRVAAHTRSLEERFLNIGMPYRIVGGIKFYERKEIKDSIAYLRIVNNYSDDLAFERIINVPKRGIGQVTLNKINLISRKNNISMFEASTIFLQSNEKNKAKNEISKLIAKIHKWHKLKKQINHYELFELIMEDSGYMEQLNVEKQQKDNIENYDRLDNVYELKNSLKEFNNLEGFLEHISLVLDNERMNENNKINLMTIHSAKGLEFDYVFLIGWEEGLFPSNKSIEEKGNLGLEEERRLAYVSLTRAKKNVYISYVNQNRYSYISRDTNMPSRFISELPKDDLEIFDSNFFSKDSYFEGFNQIEEFDIDKLTPGKKRMIENYKINKEDNWEFNQDIVVKNDNKFNEGERIFHMKFGYGRILEIEGKSALINFEKGGSKMVFLDYISKG